MPVVGCGIARTALVKQSIGGGSLRGAGDSRAPMVVAATGLWGVRIPPAFYFSRTLGMGIVGVWVAMTIDLFLRFGLSATRYLSGRGKERVASVTHRRVPAVWSGHSAPSAWHLVVRGRALSIQQTAESATLQGMGVVPGC